MTQSTFIPNSFQTPNAIIDTLMPLLTDSELRVLMYMTRHILGWKKRASSCRATISLSNFENGFSYEDSDGNTHEYAGVGLAKNTIRNALKKLKEFKIVKQIGKAGNRGKEWELAFMTDDDVDIEGLKDRQNSKKKQAKKQTQAARKKSPKNNPEDHQGISSTDTAQGISSTDTDPISSTDTKGISSTDPNETHRKDHRKDQSVVSEKSDTQKRDRNRLFDGVAKLSFGIEDTTSQAAKAMLKTAGGRIGKIVKFLKEVGATPESLRDFYKWYGVEYPDVSPPRDDAKFAEHYMQFRQGGTKKSPEPQRPEYKPFEPLPEISDEDRAESLKIMERYKAQFRKAVGD